MYKKILNKNNIPCYFTVKKDLKYTANKQSNPKTKKIPNFTTFPTKPRKNKRKKPKVTKEVTLKKTLPQIETQTTIISIKNQKQSSLKTYQIIIIYCISISVTILILAVFVLRRKIKTKFNNFKRELFIN